MNLTDIASTLWTSWERDDWAFVNLLQFPQQDKVVPTGNHNIAAADDEDDDSNILIIISLSWCT